jgi:NADH-quinone oxidoreductase E subunit
MSLKLSSQAMKRIKEVMSRYPQKQAALLPILHIVQEDKGFIPEELEQALADLVEVPVIKVREVLSFYTLFNRQPIGKYHVQLCRTISCTLCGHRDILKYVQEKLGIEVGQTTPDGKFTLSVVECLAACETAPMMQINENYYGNLSPARIDEILGNLKNA